MVDFVKLVIPPQVIEGLDRNPLLEFKLEINKSTGEESKKSTAEYQGLKFIIKSSKYAEIQGSLHKYKNNGHHNADDFTLIDLIEVIDDINNKFQISFESFTVMNIEFGVNIEPPIKTNTILDNLLYHQGQKFKDAFVPGGNYKQVGHSRYYLKMYNKHIQYKGMYGLPDIENMRIELKFRRMIDLNTLGLYCLKDLFKPSILDALYGLLINSWVNTLLFDKTIDKKALKPYTGNTKYHQWSNPKYWLELPKQRRLEQKKKYNKVVLELSDKIHTQIGRLINDKWKILVNNSLPINHQIINVKPLLINHSIIGLEGNSRFNQSSI